MVMVEIVFVTVMIIMVAIMMTTKGVNSILMMMIMIKKLIFNKWLIKIPKQSKKCSWDDYVLPQYETNPNSTLVFV